MFVVALGSIAAESVVIVSTLLLALRLVARVIHPLALTMVLHSLVRATVFGSIQLSIVLMTDLGTSCVVDSHQVASVLTVCYWLLHLHLATSLSKLLLTLLCKHCVH